MAEGFYLIFFSNFIIFKLNEFQFYHSNPLSCNFYIYISGFLFFHFISDIFFTILKKSQKGFNFMSKFDPYFYWRVCVAL